MNGTAGLVAAAEARLREDGGIFWESCGRRGRNPWLATSTGDLPEAAHPPGGLPPMQAPGNAPPSPSAQAPTRARGKAGACAHAPGRTDGATYAHDGTLEGIFTAVYLAFLARDSAADLEEAQHLQPRLGQEVVTVETDLRRALMARRALEYAQGTDAFACVRAAAASDDPCKGTIIYRFIRHAVASSARNGCLSCPGKAGCTCACTVPGSCPILDDLGNPTVYDLMRLYRSVMNERHKMEQFIRFRHCGGDVWYARCNPSASVVPLLMDWFVARFNDQRFVIYDENHGISGVYDGRRWHLVAGDEPTPPPDDADEREMQRAWRRFYRSVSVDERYHPELRRGFMPMRLWRNLPELQAEIDGHY